MHPEIRTKSGLTHDYARELRHALIVLAAEAIPETDQVVLIIDSAFGDSGVCVTVPADRPRPSALPRTAVCRMRLGRLIRSLFPEAKSASAVCYHGGQLVAAVDLPV